eukprot:gnl/TRDRNA2_/TRDRNA2_179837_c0_seq1.p1 gnl/TRDRNA2_/TRDRNA2_179837_c0~~gnl/TRDRNA2_/TRDRNA2_179837_c0_seq1.p1  ORF type:complete len:379 (-),score=68.68 gnl/TRDRNA2_/TRDRNA2_179837_c0_seq1:45-1067(-)
MPRHANLAQAEQDALSHGGTKAECREQAPSAAPLACKELASVRAFVMNLDRRKDRMEKLERVFSEQAPWMTKLTCRVSAPDGNAFPDRLNPRLIAEDAWAAVRNRTDHRVHTKGRRLTKGAVGLMMGHARVWEQVVHSNASWGLVMEDDITKLHKGLDDFLCGLLPKEAEAARSDSQTWEYLQLQGSEMKVRDIPLKVIEGTSGNTGMYLITRDAAVKALNAVFPVTRRTAQLDAHRSFLRKGLRAYRTKHGAAEQTGSTTDSDVQILLQTGSISHDLADHQIADCDPVPEGSMVLPALAHLELSTGAKDKRDEHLIARSSFLEKWAGATHRQKIGRDSE